MEQGDAQEVAMPVNASQLLKLVEQFKDSEKLEKLVLLYEKVTGAFHSKSSYVPKKALFVQHSQ